jgi:hypothetical protein
MLQSHFYLLNKFWFIQNKKCLKWSKKLGIFHRVIKFRSELKGLHHPLDGITNPEYKLLCFIQLTKFFWKEEKALAFNRDRCCHLALCLQLILFHWHGKGNINTKWVLNAKMEILKCATISCRVLKLFHCVASSKKL